MPVLRDIAMQDASSPAPVGQPDTESQLDIEFPNRPRNHSPTPPFSTLYLQLFNPLAAARAKPTGPSTLPSAPRRKQGPWPKSPQETRRAAISRFVSNWREKVGPDIFPAFRLIVPDKDRDRQVYGLKEKTIGRALVKCLGINRNSDDAQALLNWKLPARGDAAFGTAKAGDFAGRVFDVVNKRPMLLGPGKMSIAEVNDCLDGLSMMRSEEEYLPLFRRFYNEMCAEEIMWLVRMILREMKVGATERTLFDVWHPDAQSLFKVTSSLRRVCWELCDPSTRLPSADRRVKAMQVFLPQLAQFQMHDFSALVKKMRPTEKDREFWIEEKLDGERMQMHMVSDPDIEGGKRFAFWSRKAKDYTYLYGSGLCDDSGALTRHLREVFDRGVENIILDGEMLTWDPVLNAVAPFGSLKTAALAERGSQRTSSGLRPMFKVFDILLLNDNDLTNHELKARRKALERVIVKPIEGRFEIHRKTHAKTAEEIEKALREVVAQASEGLVLKNPRTPYSLSERNDDWMKVKPEYMTEYGEQLDVIVIGGYYGAGHRGGWLASFLCGLRVDENQVRRGGNPMKCLSFVKVGGGFMSEDYATIKRKTENKWRKWDKKRPPNEFVQLAGDDVQHERPDVWIRPDESVVLAIKASSVSISDKFATGFSLRFPRFQRLRDDRDWESALSLQDFLNLKGEVEKERHKKQMEIDDARKKRRKPTRKRAVTLAGQEEVKNPYGGPATECFQGLDFFIMGGSTKPKKTKPELEQLVKANGGTIHQRHDKPGENNEPLNIICIADANLVQVSALRKLGTKNIVRPSWLLDCVRQSEADRGLAHYRLPFEPKHMLFSTSAYEGQAGENVDPNGESFARDTSPEELRAILDGMPKPEAGYPADAVRAALESRGELPQLNAWILQDLRVAFLATDDELDVLDPLSLRSYQARRTVRFAGATVTDSLEEGRTTHVVVCGRDEGEVRSRAVDVRRKVSTWKKLPRVVGLEWVEACWKERTRVDEERFGDL